MTRAVLRGLAARPLRTALTAFAVLLGVALVSAALTLTDTMRAASGSLSASAYDGTAAVVSAKPPFEAERWQAERPTLPEATLAEVRRAPGVTTAAGDVTAEAKVIGRDGRPLGEGPHFGVGIDVPAVRRAPSLTPLRLRDGRWAAGPGEVVLDAATAEDQGLRLGSAVRVSAGGRARSFRLVGTVSFGSVASLGTATVAAFDLRTAQGLFGKAGRLDAVLVAGDARGLREALPAGARVQSAREHDRFDLGGLDDFIGIIRIALLVFGGIAVLVGALTIANTLSITVAQRTRELGVLRMVGASRGQVLRGVLLEALVLGLLASAAGAAAGIGLALGLQGLFAALGLDLPDAGLVVEGRTVAIAMAVGILATVAAGLLPAWRATRVAPVAALRAAGGGVAEAGVVGRGIAAVVGLLGRPAERLGGAAGALARRNAMRHPGRTAATATALVVGVALVTLVTVVATGLKQTATASVSDRIAADHVVLATDGWSPMDGEVERALAGTAGVEAVTSLRQDGGRVLGDAEVVNAIDPRTAAGLLDLDWVEGSSATLAGLDAGGAIVDEGWAEEHGLGVGDRFEVVGTRGRELSLVVRGIEGSPVVDVLGLGPITVTQAAFDGAFAQTRNRMTVVRAEDEAAVRRALAPWPDVEVSATSAYAKAAAAEIDPLIAIFGALLALCVVVSLFGIVNALVLATFERLRELGTLRSIGMSRRQVRRMVRHEAVITALLGAAVGIVAGLGLAWAVTSAFAEEGLRFAVSVPVLGGFVLVAVLAGIAAAVLPARRAARTDVLAALAYE